MVVSVGNFLAGFLCGGVEASGLVGAVRFGEWNVVVEAVDGAGRGPDDRRLGIGRFADLEKRDEAGDVAVDVRVGVLHGVPDAGLSRQMHHVRKCHGVEELVEETIVVYVAFHDEDAVALEQRAAGLFQRRVVVAVEVVDPDDAVSALLERQRDVGPNETGGAGDQYGHAAGSVDLGGVADLLLPLDAAPGGGEVPATGVDEALETQIRRRQGDQEQGPQEHGAGGGEAPVELAVHAVATLDLELAWRRWKQLIFQCGRHSLVSLFLCFL